MSKEKGKRCADGVYVDGREALIAPDGYVRVLPVQEIREAPDYRAKIVKKLIGAAVALAVAALLVWVLIDRLL